MAGVHQITGATKAGRCISACSDPGAALVAAEKASDFAGGIELARHSIDSGAALGKLEALIKYTNSVAVAQ